MDKLSNRTTQFLCLMELISVPLANVSLSKDNKQQPRQPRISRTNLNKLLIIKLNLSRKNSQTSKKKTFSLVREHNLAETLKLTRKIFPTVKTRQIIFLIMRKRISRVRMVVILVLKDKESHPTTHNNQPTLVPSNNIKMPVVMGNHHLR